MTSSVSSRAQVPTPEPRCRHLFEPPGAACAGSPELVSCTTLRTRARIGLAVEQLADSGTVSPELYTTALRLLLAPDG